MKLQLAFIGSLIAVTLLILPQSVSANRTYTEGIGTVSFPPLALGFEKIADNLSEAVAITHAGDQSGRVFITLQSGKILIFNGSQVLTTPFLDISPLVLCCGERGLLSVAFHPSYEVNGFFFLNYTRVLDGATVIASYHVSADPNVADPASAVVILTIPQDFANHNGGQLQFGPDGYLYIGMGDGGGGGDPNNRAQDPESLLGKMLRINVNADLPYTIPADNPFVGDAEVLDEIWALGLRNPWRFSFDRLTGDLFIADVGQGSWEEVNLQLASSLSGNNYGWSCLEGSHPYNTSRDCSAKGKLTMPILEYSHSFGCSITGGYRYRGTQYLGIYGTYFYGDFCSGNIWGATQQSGGWSSSLMANTEFTIPTFGEDEQGELYLADRAQGGLYHMITTGGGYKDIAVFRASTGIWLINAHGSFTYGTTGDIPVRADYNADGTPEAAIFRPSNGTWYIRGIGPFVYGTNGDIPVPADYNGDNATDLAVFRPSNGTWYIRGIGPVVYGTSGDIPVPADYNGDGKADLAVFRPSDGTWYVRGQGRFMYGISGDIPVPADYNGDDLVEMAVFRPSNGTWYVRGLGPYVYGTNGDIPVPGNYTGDVAAELAIYRPSNATWYIRGIGPIPFGQVGDIPASPSFVP